MEFSVATKHELARVYPDQQCCRLAELSALVRLDGTIQISGGRIGVSVRSDAPDVARKVFTLIKQLFDLPVEVTVVKRVRFRKGNFYVVRVPEGPKAMDMLKSLGIMSEDNSLVPGAPSEIIKRRCCKRAYLRGAFLGGGYVADPDRTYHLEIVTESTELAMDVARIAGAFGISAKVTHNKDSALVYVKESDQVVDLLRVMGASKALMDLENIRIVKDMRNQVNRLVNAETANMTKTVNAAVRQVDDIRFIARTIGLDGLPPALKEVAELRMAHPDVSLKELGELLNPPVGKSGVSHRIRRLEELAEKLRQGNGHSR